MNSNNHFSLGYALLVARHFREARAAFTDATALTPNDTFANSWVGMTYYWSGDFQSARAACESVQAADHFNRAFCLAVTYDELGRHADAETAFAQMRASLRGADAVFHAAIYAQWGDTAHALDWLETAMRNGRGF